MNSRTLRSPWQTHSAVSPQKTWVRPDVGVREGGGEVLPPGEHAPHPGVGLAEVDLDLSGQPARRQEALGVPAVALAGHLLPALPRVALHGGVRALVAPLVPEPHVHPHGRVALLAPVPAVVVEPGVDRLPVRREQLALRLLPLRRLGRQVLHPGVLPGRRLRDADRPRNRGYRFPDSRPSAHVLYPVHADHLPSGPPHVASRGNDIVGPAAGGRRAHAQTRNFFVPGPETFRCSNGAGTGNPYQTMMFGGWRVLP